MNNGIGNQNFCVSMIQLKLKQLGYTIDVDGIYGQKTADNVKLFQQKTGLTQDGVVGPRTWARMVQANNCSDPAAKQGCTL
ncbi:peptidoglycan-binding protein [bacterium]|nr:MAG: peptidoglycan-binding protein [bacterium]